MSLWAQFQELPEEAKHQFSMTYNDSFPIEVRCALAQWIEDKPWRDLEIDNPQHESYAAHLVETFIREIEAKVNQEGDFVNKLKLSQAAHNFRQNYSRNPFLLVKIVKHCLSNDAKIIQQAQNVS